MGDEVNGPPIKEATRAARSGPQRGVFKSGEKGGKKPRSGDILRLLCRQPLRTWSPTRGAGRRSRPFTLSGTAERLPRRKGEGAVLDDLGQPVVVVLDRPPPQSART